MPTGSCNLFALNGQQFFAGGQAQAAPQYQLRQLSLAATGDGAGDWQDWQVTEPRPDAPRPDEILGIAQVHRARHRAAAKRQ